ncbi:hypothetical protein JTB14_034321 [Gonioctena quinquepunctata]|nr:hypothetical protein JTB14_034321 [Gonioctena quinquepunctata]
MVSGVSIIDEISGRQREKNTVMVQNVPMIRTYAPSSSEGERIGYTCREVSYGYITLLVVGIEQLVGDFEDISVGVLFRARMKFDFFIIFLCAVGLHAAKKVKKTSTSSIENSTSPSKSAIIAIQIIDPEDEKTGGKNAKRTIESSLGYGYGNSFSGGRQQLPRYQVYKYSQHNIPPYNGPSINFNHESKNGYLNHGSHQYQPGTTLFSTINQNGHVDALSSNVPSSINHPADTPIPVIILRILPSQLGSFNQPLYPKIPGSNYFAPIVNSIDLRSLLANYAENNYAQQNYQHETQQSHPQQQSYQTEESYQQTRGPQQFHQPQEVYEPTQGYQSQENIISKQSSYPQRTPEPKPTYPQTQQLQQDYSSEGIHPSQQNHQAAQTYQEEPIYSQQPQQYDYQDYQGNDQNSYQYEDVRQDTSIQVVKSKEIPIQQPEYQTQSQASTQYVPQKTGHGLLTYENYPSDKHTRVVFKTPEGEIRNSQKEEYTVQQDTQQPEPHQAAPQIEYQYEDSNGDYSERTGDNYENSYENPEEKKVESTKLYYVPQKQKG